LAWPHEISVEDLTDGCEAPYTCAVTVGKDQWVLTEEDIQDPRDTPTLRWSVEIDERDGAVIARAAYDGMIVTSGQGSTRDLCVLLGFPNKKVIGHLGPLVPISQSLDRASVIVNGGQNCLYYPQTRSQPLQGQF